MSIDEQLLAGELTGARLGLQLVAANIVQAGELAQLVPGAEDTLREPLKEAAQHVAAAQEALSRKEPTSIDIEATHEQTS